MDKRIIEHIELDRMKSLESDGFEDHNLGMIIDTETTGINMDHDEIMSLCILPFRFDDNYQVTKFYDPFMFWNDPTVEISDFVTRLTGISKSDLEGEELDKRKIVKILSKADLVIAHHAKFDRNILEKEIPALKDLELVWGCSMEDIDWEDRLILSRVLDYVLFRIGFYFTHHEADTDCYAVGQILLHNHGEFLKEIAERAYSAAEYGKFYARKTPFSEKEILKSNGYRWDPDMKSWYKSIHSDDIDKEMDFLENSVSSYDDLFVQESIFERFRNGG